MLGIPIQVFQDNFVPLPTNLVDDFHFICEERYIESQPLCFLSSRFLLTGPSFLLPCSKSLELKIPKLWGTVEGSCCLEMSQLVTS